MCKCYEFRRGFDVKQRGVEQHSPPHHPLAARVAAVGARGTGLGTVPAAGLEWAGS